ncbi:hypothetical protein [Geitlerinema sp. PCC 9228]|uniref:hypothetical protein n=1 Tax=Geitlerinema sp. PCC 9228 TaxID=111611 RepID=UPI0008F9D6FE|nr:hypothetical protein [Geitlerinema sp. PCC 9228]
MIGFRFVSAIVGSVLVLSAFATAHAANRTYTGTVERVWEDGFRLQTSDRALTVDSWDVCGDFTASYIDAGDEVTVTGEFDDGEFDAFSITNSNDEKICN